ncbi:MAG: glycosyltransferase family 9 protein [Nanoarchaeota archaeon]
MAQEEALRYSGYLGKGMEFYDPRKRKVLIIKLGAMGDVLRTTPVLLGLKKKYDNIMIYWVTSPESVALLENNPLIDKILPYNFESVLRLMYEKFDLVFSFEIDAPGTLLANIVKAKRKFGYYFNDRGMTSCYNRFAEQHLKIAFSDELKVKNSKSYQEMMFEVAELPFHGESYMLELTDEIRSYGEKFKKKNNFKSNDILIGLNMASGKRWPSKLWSQEKISEFVKALSKNKNVKIILLGGPEEKFLAQLQSALKKKGLKVYAKNTSDSIEEFIGIINICDCLVTTDSLGLHISLALKKKTIVLFFSTLGNEIKSEPYLVKLQSLLIKKYFYVNEYEKELANSISVQDVVSAIRKLNIF